MYVNPCTRVKAQGISRQAFRLQQTKIKIRIYLGISTLGETAEFQVTQPEINSADPEEVGKKKTLAFPRRDKVEGKG